jgi:hypothetical protein
MPQPGRGRTFDKFARLTPAEGWCNSEVMKFNPLLLVCPAFLSLAAPGMAATGPVFAGDPPDDNHPWAVHDRNRPLPPVVTPGTFSTQDKPGKPPSDAIVLFDGTDLSKWQSGKGAPAEWLVRDGYMEAKPGSGDVRTKEAFGDCQLHVEWAAPAEIKGSGQGRGNSGIFLMGMVEIQVLDSYNNPTYADGLAGSYYGVNPPMANALRPPGEYQVYDIVFRRPVYRDGQVLDPGYVTVFVNGVLVQDHTPLEGSGGHMGRTKPGPFPEKGPLRLQDHGDAVRFRNIWYRELPPRAVEGGTDGWLTKEATMAKRMETAASIRQDAEKLRKQDNPLPEMLRLMESLKYEQHQATMERVERLAGQYLANLKQLSSEQLPGRRDEVTNVNNAFKFLTRWKIVPPDWSPAVEIDQFFRAQGWDKKKRN